MNLVDVYRFERLGRGPWHQHGMDNYCHHVYSIADRIGHGSDNICRMPAPDEEGYPHRITGTALRCGVEKEWIDRWFPPRVRAAMAKHDYLCLLYEVNSDYHENWIGPSQVLFLPHHSRLRFILNPETLQPLAACPLPPYHQPVVAPMPATLQETCTNA